MSTQFCNSGVLVIIGSTCSNETRTREIRFSFSSYFCLRLWWGFCHYIFTESFIVCLYPSVYCISIPSRLVVFIPHKLILFEYTIHISLWARMIRYDGKMRKIFVHNFDLRQVFKTLIWCMLCWCNFAAIMAILLLRIDAESVWCSRFAVESELVMILWNELAFFTKIIFSRKIWA